MTWGIGKGKAPGKWTWGSVWRGDGTDVRWNIPMIGTCLQTFTTILLHFIPPFQHEFGTRWHGEYEKEKPPVNGHGDQSGGVVE